MTAYTMFLFFESQHKGELVKYLVEALFGKRREWRVTNGNYAPSCVPWWCVARALLFGAFLHVRVRLARK